MYINLDDVVSQLQAAGLDVSAVDLVIGSEKFTRVRVDGRRGKPGWYRLSACGELLYGSFGVCEGADYGSQRVAVDRKHRQTLTPEQLAAQRAQQERERKELARKTAENHERAARHAVARWRRCLSVGDSAYLIKKGLPPGRLFGARLSPLGNLVVPMQDAAGKTWGLQLIYSDPAIIKKKGRDKDFFPAGLLKSGHFFQIGAIRTGDVVLVAEGFATAATLHEATTLPVVVAFDAGNLLPVCQALVKAWRGLRLLVCADDDYLQVCQACKTYTTVETAVCQHCGQPHRQRNSGRYCAELVKMTLGESVGVTFPRFDSPRSLKRKGATDFNDLAASPDGGLHAVRQQIRSSLLALDWESRGHRTASVAEVGEGGGARAPLRGNISLEEAQERWALIYGAKDTMFDFDERVLVAKSNVLDLLPDHAWREWKRNGMKVARIDEVGFDPTDRDSNILCNLWGGWPTTPKAGCCDRLLELLRHLCSLEASAEQLYQWVLRWLAYPLQHPGAKMRSTLIFHGPQGAGKNLFFETYMAIFGRYGRVIDQSAIEDKFNDFASKALFLIADEVVARADLWHIKNKLKGLITNEWIRINPKQIAAYHERNHLNLVFLSNEHMPAVIEAEDRRHCVVWTPRSLSKAFYDGVSAELAAGGREALHWHLLHLDLGDFDAHSKPPATRAKADVQELSAGSIERFVRDWTAGELEFPICPCSSAQAFAAYSRWCGARGERARAQNHLSGFIGKLPGWFIGLKDCFETAHYSGGRKRLRVVLPSDDLLQKGADYRRRPDQNEAEWITDGVFAFRQALGEVA